MGFIGEIQRRAKSSNGIIKVSEQILEVALDISRIRIITRSIMLDDE